MKTHDLQILQHFHNELGLLLHHYATCTCGTKPHPDYIEGITSEATEPRAKLIADQDTNELEKNIQFCPCGNGKPPIILLDDDITWKIRCQSGCFEVYGYPTKKEAIEAWNELKYARHNN